MLLAVAGGTGLAGATVDARVQTLLRDGVVAGAVAGVVGGVPSTAWALVTGRDPREATLAAGTIALPAERRVGRLLVAGGVTHAVISCGWGVVLAVALPRSTGSAVASGAVAGLAIAALDLGTVGRRRPRLRALALAPQVADHVVYGVVAALVLRRRAAQRVR